MKGGRSGFEILAIGDVHLGTRPGRVPDDLGIDPELLTPEAALRATVDHAIEAAVDAVLFAGDVVESSNARFEALRPLEEAIDRLADADIHAYAVVGNHDVEALPRLAARIEGLQLIGERGTWQNPVLECGSGSRVELVGWSFPQARVTTSPLAELLASPLEPVAGCVARIGVLHADLGAAAGPYAPINRRELDATGLDAWLLGHIHRPSLSADDAVPCGYLGSLLGLDPTETGPHGPWRVHGDEGAVRVEQLPLAPLRWERLDVEVAPDDSVDEVGDKLLDTIERAVLEIQQAQTGAAPPSALGVRARLVGASRQHDAIHRQIERGVWLEARRNVGGTAAFVDKVDESLGLAIDLEDLARGDDPPGLLARKLLALERGGDERGALLEEARAALRSRADAVAFAALADRRGSSDPLADDALARMLTRSGTAALQALLAQRSAAEPA